MADDLLIVDDRRTGDLRSALGTTLHLRSADIRLPWQSYRASFTAPAGGHSVRLPFAGFEGYRISAPLDLE